MNTKTGMLGNVATYILLVILIATIGYGGWKLRRWYHYQFGYKAKVQEEVKAQLKPLLQRISALESNVSTLKQP